MEIRSLADTHFDTLFQAFSQAFDDYEVQLDAEQLWKMLKRRGFDPRLSFAAFDADRIAAFTLNGIGTCNGIPTAYDTGTGTLKEYRGQGLATRIFEHAIPYLKAANIGQYLLEVLQHNTKAISVYRNLGFEVTREFNYFIQEKKLVDVGTKAPDFPYIVQRIDTCEDPCFPKFRDFNPSWQNSPGAIERAAGELAGLGVFAKDRLTGYCIFEPASGDITQLAVDRPYRRRGVGSLLLREAVKQTESDAIKVINTDVRFDAITRFLERMHIPARGKQFEMTKTI